MAHRQFTDIDFSSVTAGKKVQNKSGKGATVKLSGSSGSPISGKTPFLLCRFGINTEEVAARDGLEGYSKRSLRPSLDGYSENEQLGQFVNSIKQMDNTIIDIAIKNPQWFDEDEIDKKLARKLYVPMFKEKEKKDDKNVKYYSFKGKLTSKTKAYNTEKPPQMVDIDDYLKPYSEVKCLIEITGLWFVGDKFGPSVIIHQVQIIQSEGRQETCAFETDADDNEANERTKIVQDREREREEKVEEEIERLQLSDEELSSDMEESESEEEREPTPPPTKKKGKKSSR